MRAIRRIGRAESLPGNEDSPGILRRDCAPSRLEGRLVEHRRIAAERPGGVDAHLRREAVSSARTDRATADLVHDDETSVRLEPRRSRPFHGAIMYHSDRL